MVNPEPNPGSRLLPDDLVDWPRRLASEQGLLFEVLAKAPSRRVLDLGCGTGRHARFLVENGYEVVAIDASERALSRAMSSSELPGLEFVLGEIGAVERSVRGHFGAALCLGNTLPYLLSTESVSRMLVGLKRRLLPGAPVVLQTLNYDRDLAGDQRALPVEFVPGAADGDEIAVFRAIEPGEDGIVVLTTAAWSYRPTAVPPMEVIEARAMQLRAWKSEELRVLLEVSRLPVRALYGDVDGTPFEPRTSHHLIVVAG